MMSFSRSTILLLLAVGLVLTGIAVVDLNRALHGLSTSAELVQQAYRTIVRTDALLATLQDAETGQRGYLLTRENRYLVPYTSAQRRIGGQLAALDEIADGGVQQATINEVRRLANLKMAELQRTITLAQAGQPDAAAAVVRSGEGQALMERIRFQLGGFGTREQALLSERQAAFAEAERQALLGALAAGVLAVIGALAASVLLWRSGRRTERILDDTSAELDSRLTLLRATYDTAPVGLCFVDRALHFTAINQALASINGRPVEAHVGRTIREALPEMANMLEPLYAQVLEQARPLIRVPVTAAIGTSGHRRNFEASYWPVRSSDGAIVGVNTAVLDVTERLQAETALRELTSTLEAQVEERTLELESANKQLEAFAYTISHDLRAPLRAMEGFARILLEDHEAALGADGGRYARRIVSAAERMEHLIDDLLTFSRLQQAEVVLRAIDPTTIVDAAIEQAQAADPTAQFEVPAPLPAVLAEPVVLSHVIANLISNAVKFRPADRPARVTVTGSVVDGRARICIADEGIGIAPEHRERIFAVFERLHGQEAYPGTGIGLAIVKAGIERMGGHVGIEVNSGAGTTFWLDLATPGGQEGQY